jgi:xanthine dehydrogenase accessory factor
MGGSMHDALAIYRFLAVRARRGERAVLVTLTDVTGSAARAPGEQMAVAQDGAFVGSFSGGCVEAAVVAEAQDVLAEGRPRQVRFGAGSPYIDIRLPCGGGIDLLFTPDPVADRIASAVQALEARQPISLRLLPSGAMDVRRCSDEQETGWDGPVFAVQHDPALRIVIMGHGAEPGALADLAVAYGAEVHLLTPQSALLESTRAKGLPATLLRTLGPSDALVADRWTAVIALFHDHDWETALLDQALRSDAFFIGAMGSRKTHADRLNRLAEAGCSPADLARVVGPVGLIPATRDPRALAVSILAQVVDALGSAATGASSGSFSAAAKMSVMAA